jgi:hypothetical protein
MKPFKIIIVHNKGNGNTINMYSSPKKESLLKKFLQKFLEKFLT